MPLGHLGINVADLGAAKQYYDQLMPLVGYEPFFATDDEFSYRPVDGKPGTFLFFYPSQEPGGYSRHRSGLQHLAFIVKTRPEVHAARDAAHRLGSDVIIETERVPRVPPRLLRGVLAGSVRSDARGRLPPRPGVRARPDGG